VENLRSAGTTILLTTHYMDEAQALADRVAVIATGQIVAAGPPATIGGRDTAQARIRFGLPDGHAAGDLPFETTADGDGLLTLLTDEPTGLLHQLTGWALDHGVALSRLTVDRPSLEDVYLRLTDSPTEEPDPAPSRKSSRRRATTRSA
jgi:ABC-2 type transport system ATP-binding protein